MTEERDKQLRRVMGLGKFELEKLVKILTDQKITGSKKELAEFLIKNKSEEVTLYLENHKKLRYVSTYRAVDYLRQHYPQKSDLLAEIITRDQLLLFLYENKLIDEIEHIEFYAAFRRKELRFAYELKGDTDLSYEQIIEKMREFVRGWNENNILKISTEHYIDTENKLVFSILREHHQKTYSQFVFREGKRSKITPDSLKIKKTKLYPIWPQRMEINKIGKGHYNIIFGFDPKVNDSIVSNFKDTIFGKSAQLNKVEMKAIKEIQKEIQQSISKSPKWEGIQKLIQDRRNPVIDRINADSTFSKEKKEELIKIVNTIDYAGSSFKDDSKTTAREFTMNIGNFPKLFSVLSSAKGFLQELFTKVSKSTENQIIRINNKDILLTKTSIKFPPINFSENEQLVLKLFFGDEE